MISIQGLHNGFLDMSSLPEAFPLPPKVVEDLAPADDVMNPHPSPMSIFEDRERDKQHLGAQKLTVPAVQPANGWYNPFAGLYSWVLNAIYGTSGDETGLTLQEKEKIKTFYDEVQKALQSVEALYDEEDNIGFEQLLLLIQKKREAEHRRNIVLQGENLKKAQVELKSAQKEVKDKTSELLDSLSRKGTIAKINHLLAPIAGLIVGLGPFPVTGTAVDVFAKPLLAVLSALGAANVLAGEPYGEQVSTAFDAALSLPVAFTGLAGFLMMASKMGLTLVKAHSEQKVKAAQGDLAILNHKTKQATEKFNDLGGKASKASQEYHKELGSLSRLLHENGELIQALFSR